MRIKTAKEEDILKLQEETKNKKKDLFKQFQKQNKKLKPSIKQNTSNNISFNTNDINSVTNKNKDIELKKKTKLLENKILELNKDLNNIKLKDKNSKSKIFKLSEKINHY